MGDTMKHVIYNIVSITALIVAAWIARSGAATVTTPLKPGSQPATAAPSTSTQTAPKITSPAGQYIPCNPAVATMGTQTPTTGGTSVVGPIATTATMGPTYVGPTPNITAVANAIGLRAKSLTAQITFKSGLVLAKPVMIMIDYSSPASQYRVNPQKYDNCNGNRFLYNDPISGPVNSPGYAVWGRPRQMTINITLTEDRPGGQPYVYTIPLQLNLDPLFDVAISPLRFTLNNDCCHWWDSDTGVRFSWRNPSGQQGKRNFDTNKGKTTTINEFAWSRQELSASANLFWPDWAFYCSDPLETGAFLEGFGTPTIKLLPAAGGYVGRTLQSWHRQSCYADTAFDMTITLRTYNNL